MSDRELASVIAALRYWQEYVAEEERDESGDFDEVRPLTDEQIDRLCRRLYLPPEDDKR